MIRGLYRLSKPAAAYRVGTDLSARCGIDLTAAIDPRRRGYELSDTAGELDSASVELQKVLIEPSGETDAAPIFLLTGAHYDISTESELFELQFYAVKIITEASAENESTILTHIIGDSAMLACAPIATAAIAAEETEVITL